MILDSSLLMDDKAALTVSRPSTNVIDIGTPRDIGIGERDLDLLVQVTTALVGPAGTTLQAQYQGSVDNVTFNTIVESRAFPAMAVPASTRFLAINVPRQSPDPDATQATQYRFFRIYWNVGGGPLTAGAVSAMIVLERSDLVNYPSNFAINS